MVRPTSRTRAPPTANRSARKKSGSPSAPTIGPRMPGFWCPTASGSMSRAVSESADGRYAMHGSLRWRSTAGRIRSSPTRCIACNTVSFPRAGIATSRASPRIPRGSRDGPTHQPVEQLASLRAIPGLITLRPADANEVREAWRVILQLRHVPAALVVSRQPLPTLDRSRYASAAGVAHGAYVLADAEGDRPDVLLLGTGSEVALCVQAHERLSASGVRSRVVSMPSWELFEQQPRSYRDGVIPPDVTARVSVEQASGFGWDRYVGPEGARIGMETFGASAPLQELQKKFGFTVEHVVAAARAQLERKGVGSHAS